MTDPAGDGVGDGAQNPASPDRQSPTQQTVEAVVREQLSKALGGKRGMLEAAAPTLLFTIIWLSTRELYLALGVSIAAALALLVARLVQRSSAQFVLNALFGIGIGWFFVYLSARGGGDANDQALAYFLPGILYNSGYAVLMVLTCVIGWPLVGFMVGSVTGDPTAWHDDKGVVRLCTRLTLLLALPCVVRAIVQAPLWLAAKSGSIDVDAAIAILGVAKIGLGWPLQLAALATMVWLLTRNRTPIDTTDPQPA